MAFFRRRFPFQPVAVSASKLDPAAAATKADDRASSSNSQADEKSHMRPSRASSPELDAAGRLAKRPHGELNEIDGTSKVELPADDPVHEMSGVATLPAQELDGRPISFEYPRPAPSPPGKSLMSLSRQLVPPPLAPSLAQGAGDLPLDSPMFFRHTPPPPPPASPTTTISLSRSTSLRSPTTVFSSGSLSPPRAPTPPPKSPRDYSRSPTSSSRRSPTPSPRCASRPRHGSLSPVPQILKPRPPPKDAERRGRRSPTPPPKG